MDEGAGLKSVVKRRRISKKHSVPYREQNEHERALSLLRRGIPYWH
jgi:hypothetical protein